jgi:hypothetical protein
MVTVDPISAELPGNPAHRLCRHERDFLDVLRRVLFDVLFEDVERRPALGAVDGVRAGQRHFVGFVLVFHARDGRVVVNLGTVVDEVPDEGIVGVGVAHVAPVGRPDQVRAVRFVHQIFGVVDAVLVEQRVDQSQRQRSVGSHADRDPLVRLGRLRALERVEHDVLESAGARVGHLSGVLHGDVPRPVALRATEIERVVAVGEIGDDRPRHVHDAVHEVGAVAAVEAAPRYPVIGRAETFHEPDYAESDFGGLRCRRLEKCAPRIPFAAFLQFFHDDVQRLIP